MNKKIIAPLVSILALGSLAIGVTYALFTSNAKAEVNINAGTVKVNYASSLEAAESRYLDLPAYDAIAAAEGTDFDAVFENGGTALVTTGESTTITLDKISPMDMVSVTTSATNDSNIDIKFRYVVELTGELVPALTIEIDGNDYSTTQTHTKFASAWSSVIEPNVKSLFVKDVDIYFPYGGDEQNFYQNKNCTISIGIEAIQGNATVTSEEVEPEVPDFEIDKGPVPDPGEKTHISNSNGSVSTITSSDSVDESAIALVLTVEKEDTPIAPVSAQQEALSLDIDEAGVKDDNETPVDLTVKIGPDKTGVKVYHEGEEIESKYDSVAGVVSFQTLSFSQFDIVWDAAKNKSYGFFNSYLDGEHWVHEISNADEFKNIVDSTVHTSKGGAYDYPGAHDEDTVFLIVNDIDFGGEIWSTQELINEVNAYPFIGHLIGISDGVTLSNVHVSTLYNGMDDDSTFCIFGRAMNATFENLTLKDCSINTTSADKAALLCAGNKTTSSKYTTLFGEEFTNKYLEFKNILIDSSCAAFGKENIAGVVACIRYISNSGHITFENCVNNANITATGTSNNTAGILGQMSNNPSDGVHTTPVTFTDCENSGTIFAAAGGNIGGLVGNLCSSNATVTNCVNRGDIKYDSNSSYGSISGGVQTGVTYVSCSNSGMIYTNSTSLTDFKNDNVKVLYNEKSAEDVSKTEFKELFVKPYVGVVIPVSIDKDNLAVNVDTSCGAHHYTMSITATKVDIDASTNKAVPQRSGTISLETFDNLSAQEVDDFMLLTQLGYFGLGEGECPVDEYHGGTRIGSRGEFVTSTFFLDYSLHGTAGYEEGYGENSKGAYYILDNTGNTTGFWQAFITFRPDITYSVTGFDEDGNIVATGKYVYSPYQLGGNNNYTTEIVGYIPEL